MRHASIFLLCASFLSVSCSSAQVGGFMNGLAEGLAAASGPPADEPVHRLRRLCKVSYETQYGWSPEITLEVQFLTGRQLNRATRSYNYDLFGNYALIWFENDEVAVLKSNEFLFGVGEDFDNEDFRRMFQFRQAAEFEQVNATHSRKWQIKGKDWIRFVDPRAEE